jgi:hypothetical protein
MKGRFALRHERGQALIEMALVSIMLLLVIVGIVEGGRAVWNYNTLAQATREGARYAVVHGSRSEDPSGPGTPGFTAPHSDDGVTGVVRDHASGLDDWALSVRSEWLDGTNHRGGRIKVSTTYNFETVFSMLFGAPPIPMKSSTIMEITY